MPRKRVEIAIEVLHIDRKMRHALRRINTDRHAEFVRRRDHFLDRIDRPERIRHMRDGNHLCPFVQKIFVFVNDKLTAFIQRNHTDLCTALLGRHLPRNDIRMMLHSTDDDLIALIDKLTPVRRCDQIDALGRTTNKDTFRNLAGINKSLYLFTRGFIGCCRVLRKIMYSAMNIRMFLGQIFRTAVNNHLRHLRRSRIVEIHERLSINCLRQHRKIFSDLFNVPIAHFPCS